MPHYDFIRNEDGSTELRPRDDLRTGPPPTPEVDAAEGLTTDNITVHRCDVCRKDYAIPALLAKHFHREHTELDTTPDVWKEHWTKVSL